MYQSDIDTGEGWDYGAEQDEVIEWNLEDSDSLPYDGSEEDFSALEGMPLYEDSEGEVDSFPKANQFEGGETSMPRMYKNRQGVWVWANSGKPVNGGSGSFRRRRY